MKQDRINVLYVVVDYVKDLFAGNEIVLANHNMDNDVKALIYLSSGNVFYTNARNGREYLYCFIRNKANVNVARNILRANNMNPNLHVSRYYCTPMLVLRTPVKEIAVNNKAQRFADKLMNERKKTVLYEGIKSYIATLRQKNK